MSLDRLVIAEWLANAPLSEVNDPAKWKAQVEKALYTTTFKGASKKFTTALLKLQDRTGKPIVFPKARNKLRKKFVDEVGALLAKSQGLERPTIPTSKPTSKTTSKPRNTSAEKKSADKKSAEKKPKSAEKKAEKKSAEKKRSSKDEKESVVASRASLLKTVKECLQKRSSDSRATMWMQGPRMMEINTEWLFTLPDEINSIYRETQTINAPFSARVLESKKHLHFPRTDGLYDIDELVSNGLLPGKPKLVSVRSQDSDWELPNTPETKREVERLFACLEQVNQKHRPGKKPFERSERQNRLAVELAEVKVQKEKFEAAWRRNQEREAKHREEQELLAKEMERKELAWIEMKKKMDLDDGDTKVRREVERDRIYSQFKDCYINNKKEVELSPAEVFSKALGHIIDIRVEMHPGGKIYVLKGNDLIFVRQVIPKEWNPPGLKNVFGKMKQARGYFKAPKWSNGLKGYMYAVNPENFKTLSTFLNCARQLNQEYAKYTRVEKLQPANDAVAAPAVVRTTGILGHEVALDVPDWLNQIIPSRGDARVNPILQADGRIAFQKCAISKRAADAAMNYLRGRNETFKANLFGEFIMRPSEMADFLRAPQWVAAGGWNHHARFMVKDADKKLLLVYDPWMTGMTVKHKDIQSLLKAIAAAGYTHKFVPRAQDQASGEGSCVMVALTRAFMIAHLPDGRTSVDEPMNPVYALLASRLISKFRNKTKATTTTTTATKRAPKTSGSKRGGSHFPAQSKRLQRTQTSVGMQWPAVGFGYRPSRPFPLPRHGGVGRAIASNPVRAHPIIARQLRV